MPTIRLPANGWRPRKYQLPLWRYLEGGGDRAMEVAHRRWGKDDVILYRTCIAAHERPASYWHLLPEQAQARKALWSAVNPHTGQRRIDEAFPRELRATTNETEMFIRFHSGSTWQLVGSDNYNSLVGAGVAGVVFSEWALANPASWGYIRPMVEENRGWAAFITTPRGNNHAKAMYDMAKNNPRWFAEISTVHDTGALSDVQLSEALTEYQALYGVDFGRAVFEQEYLCSFVGAMVGAYFGAEVARAEREGRVKPVEVDWNYPVHTAWDLGKAINNPIWCFQTIGSELRIVDFYQPDSLDIADWCEWLKNKGYQGVDYVPHDIANTEWGTSRTRLETLVLLGRRPVRLAQVSLADGLQAGRTAINAAVVDDGTCSEGRTVFGIDGLKNYRRTWDDDLKRFRDVPLKDWSEHVGSAWRYLGLAYQIATPPKAKPAVPKAPAGWVPLPGPPEPQRGGRIRL